MEAPRLRLLRLANLRGLLTPDYPHGNRSRIREELILRDLSRENEGQVELTSVILKGLLATMVRPAARGDVMSQAGDALSIAFNLLQLVPNKDLAKLKTGADESKETEELIKAYSLLKDSKLTDILRAALE